MSKVDAYEFSFWPTTAIKVDSKPAPFEKPNPKGAAPKFVLALYVCATRLAHDPRSEVAYFVAQLRVVGADLARGANSFLFNNSRFFLSANFGRPSIRWHAEGGPHEMAPAE